MAKQLLYEIKIKGLDEEIVALKTLQDETKRLRAEVKELEAAGSSEAERRKIELNETQKQYRKLQKEVQNRNKAEQESVNTLEKMRAKLSAMSQELERTEIGSEKFRTLTEQTKKLRDEINQADQATGKFQGNVGNYKNAIIDAFQQMGIDVRGFAGNIGNLGGQMAIVSRATGGATLSFKALRVAMMATGIPILIEALTKLGKIFFSTQAAVDAFQKVFLPLQTALSRIVGIIQNLGGGLAKLFSGDFRQGWADITNAVSGFGDKMRQAWQDGQRLVELSIELRQITLTLAAAEGRINRIIAEQREILQDVNRSDKERMDAGKMALLAAEQLKNLRQQEVEKQIEQLKLQQKQNDTGIEGLTKLAELGAKRDQIEAEYKNETRRIQQSINALQKKAHEDRIKAIEEERKAEAARYAESAETINRLLNEFDSLKAKGAAAMDEFFRMDEEDYIPDIPAIIEALGELQAEEVRLARQTTESIKGTYAERLAALKATLDAGLISEEQFANRKIEINRMVMADSIAALKGVATEGSKIQKALFVFEKLIAVREAFIALQKGLAKTAGSAPFPANIPLMIGFAAMVAGLISSIKAIVAPQPPKFARGVIGLQGPGTETSDSITARLSRGESVMTAKATRMFAPVLAQMEMAVGNKPNYQLGNRRFAGGFIPAEVNPLVNMDRVIERTVRSIAQIPVVVLERDITETQMRVAKIKQNGNL